MGWIDDIVDSIVSTPFSDMGEMVTTVSVGDLVSVGLEEAGNLTPAQVEAGYTATTVSALPAAPVSNHPNILDYTPVEQVAIGAGGIGIVLIFVVLILAMRKK